MRLIICLSALCVLASATVTLSKEQKEAAATRNKAKSWKLDLQWKATETVEAAKGSNGELLIEAADKEAIGVYTFDKEDNKHENGSDTYDVVFSRKEGGKTWKVTAKLSKKKGELQSISHNAQKINDALSQRVQDDGTPTTSGKMWETAKTTVDGQQNSKQEIYMELHLSKGFMFLGCGLLFWIVVLVVLVLLVVVVFMMMGGSDPEDSDEENQKDKKDKKDADKEDK